MNNAVYQSLYLVAYMVQPGTSSFMNQQEPVKVIANGSINAHT